MPKKKPPKVTPTVLGGSYSHKLISMNPPTQGGFRIEGVNSNHPADMSFSHVIVFSIKQVLFKIKY